MECFSPSWSALTCRPADSNGKGLCGNHPGLVMSCGCSCEQEGDFIAAVERTNQKLYSLQRVSKVCY